MNTLEGHAIMEEEWCAGVQENYRKTTEVVRQCEENERGAHSETKFSMWTYQGNE